MAKTAIETPEPSRDPLDVAILTDAERIVIEAAAEHYGRAVAEYRHGLLAESPDMPEMLVANLTYYFGRHLLSWQWPVPMGTAL